MKESSSSMTQNSDNHVLPHIAGDEELGLDPQGTFDPSNYNPFFPEHLADPYLWWDALTQTTPICFIPMLNMWAVIGYDCVAQVIKDTATFSSAKANYPGEVPAELSHRHPYGYPHSV